MFWSKKKLLDIIERQDFRIKILEETIFGADKPIVWPLLRESAPLVNRVKRIEAEIDPTTAENTSKVLFAGMFGMRGPTLRERIDYCERESKRLREYFGLEIHIEREKTVLRKMKTKKE